MVGCLNHFCFNLGQESYGSAWIILSNEIADLDKICPRGRQNNQTLNGSGLDCVPCTKFRKYLIRRDRWATFKTRFDRRS